MEQEFITKYIVNNSFREKSVFSINDILIIRKSLMDKLILLRNYERDSYKLRIMSIKSQNNNKLREHFQMLINERNGVIEKLYTKSGSINRENIDISIITQSYLEKFHSYEHMHYVETMKAYLQLDVEIFEKKLHGTRFRNKLLTSLQTTINIFKEYNGQISSEDLLRLQMVFINYIRMNDNITVNENIESIVLELELLNDYEKIILDNNHKDIIGIL